MLQDATYRQDPAISQSDIKLFEKNIITFYNEKILGLVEEKESDAIDIGSITDAILLVPEELKSYYVVTDLKAKGKVKDVVDMVWNEFSNCEDYKEHVRLEDLKNFVSSAIKKCEYQSNWKEETRIQKIKDEGQDYFEQLQDAKGLHMVSIESWNTAHNIVRELADDEASAKIVSWLMNPESLPPNMGAYVQYTLYGEFDSVKLKGRLDFFIKDDTAKTIEPWELKTSDTHNRFKQSYKMFKYGRQGAFYTELIKQNYPDYKVLPFKFMVLPVKNNSKLHETAASEKPEIYAMTPKELQIHTDGCFIGTGYRLKGWKELVKEIKWHMDTMKFQHHKEYYETGVNTLDTLVGIDIDITDNVDPVFY